MAHELSQLRQVSVDASHAQGAAAGEPRIGVAEASSWNEGDISLQSSLLGQGQEGRHAGQQRQQLQAEQLRRLQHQVSESERSLMTEKLRGDEAVAQAHRSEALREELGCSNATFESSEQHAIIRARSPTATSNTRSLYTSRIWIVHCFRQTSCLL